VIESAGKAEGAGSSSATFVSKLNERQKACVSVLDEAMEVFRAIDAPELADVQALRDRLIAQRVNVVFVGIWSSGKSTLINSILDERRLPMDITVESATIASVEYGEGDQMQVVYSNEGGQETFPQTKENLRDYLSAKSKRAGKLEDDVQRVVLYAPNPLLKEGAVLVDTPGVEDLNQVRADVTYQYVPRADVIMFLMNCSQAGQLSEITFLRKISQHNIRNVCFVVNMVDGRSGEEVQRVVRDLRDKVSEFVPSPRIFPVSADFAMSAKEGTRSGKDFVAAQKKDPKLRTAMSTDWRGLFEESGLPALERHLEEFITSESRSAQFVEHVLHRLQGITELHHHKMQLQNANLRRSASELRERYQAILTDLANKEALVTWVEEQFVAASRGSREAIEGAFSAEFEQTVLGRMETVIETAPPDQWRLQIQSEVEIAMRSQIDQTLNLVNRMLLELSLDIEKRRQGFFAELDDHAGSSLSGDMGIGMVDVDLTVGGVGGGYQSYDDHLIGSALGGAVLGGIGGIITLASVAISGPILPLVGVALGAMAGLGFADKKATHEQKARALSLARQTVQELIANARASCLEQMARSLKSMEREQVSFIKDQYSAVKQQFEQAIAQSELDISVQEEHRASVENSLGQLSRLDQRLSGLLPDPVDRARGGLLT